MLRLLQLTDWLTSLLAASEVSIEGAERSKQQSGSRRLDTRRGLNEREEEE